VTRPARAQRYRLQFDSERQAVIADFVGAHLVSGQGGRTALRLIASALEPSTYDQYGRLFSEFAEYCESEGVSSLPASQWTVVSYVGHLAEKGTWAADSLQPIFSAINRIHRDLGHEPPAVGNHFLTAARNGMRRAQVATSIRDSRTPLPAPAFAAVLADGESAPGDDLRRIRETLAVQLAALFGGRQDSCVHLRSCDFGVSGGFMWLRLTEKGKKGQAVRRVVRLPLQQQPVHGHSSVLPRIAALAERYLDLRTAMCSGTAPEWLLQLPGEPRPLTRHMETWLTSALQRCGISAPPGFAYLGHSIRSGGVSAMAAIGVERHLYIWLCGWARGSDTVDKHYLDPTVLPTPAAFAYYGWALSRQYYAGVGTVVLATRLPDPLAE
jgi:hypothetical protein